MASRAAQLAPAPGPPGLFVYPMDVQPPAGYGLPAAFTFDLLTDPDYDFLWDRIVAQGFIGKVYSVYLQDATNGQLLMASPQTPIFNENIAGTGSLPYWLSKKVRIAKGTVLSATFNMRVGGVASIQFCLVGKKVADA